MVTKHRTVVVGCGPRGMDHARAFLANSDRFELTALCDLEPGRLQGASDALAVPLHLYKDPAEMLRSEQPDVFCFVTPPNVRLELLELAVTQGIKAISFEKPVACSLADGRRMLDLCEEHGVKAIVAHQHKFGAHWRKVKSLIDTGAIGRLHSVHVASKGWLLQYATHLIDYGTWLGGAARAKWVVGHAHGRGKLDDSHPSPDYAFGQAELENGVRLVMEFGSLAPSWPPGNLDFWHDAGATAYGSHGFAQAIVGSGWRAVTKDSDGLVEGREAIFDQERDYIPHVEAFGASLDGGPEPFSNIRNAYHGLEIAFGICLSALEHRPVTFPLDPSSSVIQQLKAGLPDTAPIGS